MKSVGDVVGNAMGGKKGHGDPKEPVQGKKKKDDNLPKKPGGRFGNSRMNGPMKSGATPNLNSK